MGAAIEDAVEGTKVELKGGGRGDFIVTADGRQLWDKRNMGDAFPDHGEILNQLK